jgi:molybdopterin/thiamine biosynthesis adenylyltransferase
VDVFNAEKFDKRVDVIGAGAMGGHLALLLAKMGVKKLRVFDDDKVEGHNVPNQPYGLDDIGRPKVAALAGMVNRLTGMEIEAVEARVEPESEYDPADVVFLAVDSMAARRAIFERHLAKSMCQLMVEGRMGAMDGRIYAFGPGRKSHQDKWLATLYKDEEASESLCGTTVTVICNAMFIASVMASIMIRHSKGSAFENEMIYQIDPPEFAVSQKWF